jgi:hypothetical protein
MSIAEIVPVVQRLSRSERFQLAKLLIDELAKEDSLGFISGQVFPIHTPEYAPHAATQLAQVLKDSESQS